MQQNKRKIFNSEKGEVKMKSTYEGLYFFTDLYGKYQTYKVIRELPHGDYIVGCDIDLEPHERVWPAGMLQSDCIVKNHHWARSIEQLNEILEEYRLVQSDIAAQEESIRQERQKVSRGLKAQFRKEKEK